LGDDEERHVPVLDAAELGALSAVRAGLARVAHDSVLLARDQGDLAGQTRHPEAVDHVLAADPHLDWHSDRDVDLVRGADGAAAVVDVPEPLAADDGDSYLSRRAR